MLILALDTSGKAASCALLRDGALVAQKVQDSQLDHSRLLLPLCGRLLEEQGLTLRQVDLFAAVAGPGSFTGLRIGIAAVKGFALPLDKPCLGMSSLEAMAYGWDGEGRVCCAIYARPGERYFALFEKKGEEVSRLTPDRVGTEEEMTAAMASAGCHRLTEDSQRASGAAKAAWAAFCRGEAGDCHRLLPVYLRVSQAERMRQEKLEAQRKEQG